jgi:N-hydroxyarylamine O-acetyltransferase
VLEEEKLIAKIVTERRGGFCYELNGAFAALLREIGFDVKMLSACVARDEGGFGPPFDHMMLLVQLEELWLADVGFGDSFVEPLLVDGRGEQVQTSGVYRIADEDEFLIMEEKVDGRWQPQCRFTLQPFNLTDYSDMCTYHQTSPESPFTKKRTISRATADGRITLSGTRLITTARGEKLERKITNREEYAAALRDYFGVELEPPPDWFRDL